MATDAKQRNVRYDRARDKGEAAGRRVKNVLAFVAALGIGIAAFGGQIFPFLAAGALHVIGTVGLALGAVAVAMAGTIRRASDEPKERLAWFIALVFLAGAVLFYLGKL